MQVTASGWSRDHGPKELLRCEIAYRDIVENVDGYDPGETYFQVERHFRPMLDGRRKVDYTVRISAHAKLNLNGSYLIKLELDRTEIARLFYETNGDRGLPELLKLFSAFKDQDELGYARHEVKALTKEEIPSNPVMLTKVDELGLSVRSGNYLKNDNIVYVGDLVQKSEAEILRTPNAGRKVLNEIKEVLASMGLRFGMEVPGWPPDNIFEERY